MYSDKELIQGIKNRDNDVLEYIYQEYYPSIQYLINSNHGSDEAARDLFQDVILVVYTKIRNNELALNCSFKTFVYAVGRNLWLKQLHNQRRWNLVPLENNEPIFGNDMDEIEIINVDDIKKLLYQKHFLKLNTICQQILEMVINKHSFREISIRLNLKNEQYARKRKYRCIQTLINSIQNDSQYKTLIKNEI